MAEAFGVSSERGTKLTPGPVTGGGGPADGFGEATDRWNDLGGTPNANSPKQRNLFRRSLRLAICGSQ